MPSLAVLGGADLVGDGNFTLTRTANGVRAEKLLAGGLRLVKEFHLGSNYLVYADIWLENTTDKPLALPAQVYVVGTATPMDPDDTGLGEGAMWSNGSKAVDQPLALFIGGGCTRSAPKTEITAGANNVVWAAAHNQFFALMAIPKDRPQEMLAQPVILPPFPNVTDSNQPLPRGIQTSLVYPASTVPPRGSS